jgi:hypothetical protein
MLNRYAIYRGIASVGMGVAMAVNGVPFMHPAFWVAAIYGFVLTLIESAEQIADK